jgi:nucleoside-diphosphate-sugar epimerase
MQQNILVLGASGQIGTELVEALRSLYGNAHVVASDIKEEPSSVLLKGPYEVINAMDRERLEAVVAKYQITQVYHLVAMLSATAEKMPRKGWDLNMETLFHVLEMAREEKIQKVYWPSSIAAFGPTTPKTEVPQHTVMDPTTVYGISKLSGELWCDYYHKKYGVDVRSLRYPGLISYKTLPGGGTTDYAVDIFHQAKAKGHYTCFLEENTALPMMYMPDAIKATIGIMEAPADQVKIRTSYNLAAFSFDPKTLAQGIQKHLGDFTIDYAPDFRQDIAKNWPQSIDDTAAREDWGWQNDYNLEDMIEDMLQNV